MQRQVNDLMYPLRLNPFAADRFTITACLGQTEHKLFQVLFADRQGGVYVNFPYFRHQQGIAAVATVPASDEEPSNINLQQEGRLTSHLVKYSHHIDGRAHFSQDGRVRTELVKQSVPLGSLAGHMFTVYLNGIADFLHATSRDVGTPTRKHSRITFPFPEGDPGWIKIVGYWYSRSRCLGTYHHLAVNGQVGPIIRDFDTGGQRVQRALLAPWNGGRTGKSILALEAQRLPTFRCDGGSTLLFVGGFDNQAVVVDPQQDTKVLMFKYPASDFDELSKVLSSIDWRPD